MSVCLAQKQNDLLSAEQGFRSRGLTTHLDHPHLLQLGEGNFQRDESPPFQTYQTTKEGVDVETLTVSVSLRQVQPVPNLAIFIERGNSGVCVAKTAESKRQ